MNLLEFVVWKKHLTDGPTDRWTDGPTDKASYRDAWTHLKRRRRKGRKKKKEEEKGRRRRIDH